MNPTESIKILSIGNSFSDDALEYFWDIANDCGIKKIVVGILYKPGARLQHHTDSINANLSDYIYRKNTSGAWVNRDNSSIEYGLKDEDWDIITMQQSSGYSGLEASYQPYLNQLISYVREKTNYKDIKLYWHMTWAYQRDYKAYNVFADWYDNDQIKMYNQILESVKKHIVPNKAFYDIIPSGTTIQNARTSFIGDNFTIDGYHLTRDLGRFGAALTWFYKLTGLPLENIRFKPDGVSDIKKSMLIDAAYKAIRNPFDITKSAYPDRHP